MKAISLHQPFASLTMLNGTEPNRIAKMFETRTWSTKYRGPLAIHATAVSPSKYRILFHYDYFRSVFAKNGIHHIEALPFGKVIGIVDLIDCMPSADALRHGLMTQPETYFGNYEPGRFAWLFENPRPFHLPKPATGHQGFWNWEEEL